MYEPELENDKFLFTEACLSPKLVSDNVWYIYRYSPLMGLRVKDDTACLPVGLEYVKPAQVIRLTDTCQHGCFSSLGPPFSGWKT